MPTFNVRVKGAETPEGLKRIEVASELRNQADFECFRLLSELDRFGLFSKNGLLHFLSLEPDCNPEENEEFAEHYSSKVKEALHARLMANEEFMNALAGR